MSELNLLGKITQLRYGKRSPSVLASLLKNDMELKVNQDLVSRDEQGWKYRLEIDNRYSLLFRLRMQKFSTFFFHYRLGLFPTFSRGKSILINQ